MAHLIAAFIALFTITNPLGNIPLFLSLTWQQSEAQQRRTAIGASAAALVVLLVTLLLGQSILNALHIRFEAFMLAGSLVIAALAWSMVNIRTSRQQHAEEEKDEIDSQSAVTVVPLAIPILAGPGAISTVIGYHAGADPGKLLVDAGAIAAVSVSIGVILSLATRIRALLGVTGLNVLTRLFGLLLLSIAIGNAATALRALFPSLAR